MSEKNIKNDSLGSEKNIKNDSLGSEKNIKNDSLDSEKNIKNDSLDSENIMYFLEDGWDDEISKESCTNIFQKIKTKNYNLKNDKNPVKNIGKELSELINEDDEFKEEEKLIVQLDKEHKPFVDLSLKTKKREEKDNSDYLNTIKSNDSANNGVILNAAVDEDNYFSQYANCKFTAKCIKYITDRSGKSVMYSLSGQMIDGTPLKEIDISAYEYQNQAWIHKRFGIQCRIGPSENAYRVISTELSDQFTHVEKKHIYKVGGWHRGFYSQGDEPIGPTDENVSCECTNYIEVRKNFSEESAFLHVLKMLTIASKRITRTLFGFTDVGILRQLFEDSGNTPRFLLWVMGETGSFKTTLAKEFAIIYNRSKSNINASFRDTPAGIEYKAAEFKDSVLILDDYYPASSSYEKQKLNIITDHIIRLYGDDIPRTRMNSKMEKQKEFKPSGVCLVTGEDYVSNQSSKSRCIQLPIDKSDVDLEVLSECQEHPKNFSTCIYYFIEYVANNYEIIVKEIKKKFKDYRKYYRNDFSHGRLLDAYISLHLAYEVFLDYGVHINVLGVKDKDKELNEASEDFFKLVMNMNYELYSEEPGMLYSKAVDELISSNQVHVSNQLDAKHDRVGWVDDQYYYLYPDLMLGEVVKFYQRQDRKYSASKVKSHRALHALGLLKTDGDKLTTKQSPYASGRKRYLVIDKYKLNELLENF